MIRLRWLFATVRKFPSHLAGAIFADAILTAVPFRILCALLFAVFVQLAWTVCDGGFDKHFESARLLILLSAEADL